MPPLSPVLDYELFYQYHNRLASFLDWPLNWEMEKEKPTPEVFARAGFFSHAEPPYLPDNVVCLFCRIYLDEWEPHDDPMSEHEKRSPSCPFIRGETPVRKIDREATVRSTQAQLGSTDKFPGDAKLPNYQKPQDGQEPQYDDKRHGNNP
ncbi:Baculoviral IAP repeat-containing protein 2 [Cytospora paraplurivora]|uniref:Baculoviral IAP repeat-containing protein 2 n=1 Tax=Cytospora paraplurivora TaxID=2898453 RepID=A0AAN9U8T2_9PEZI